ncbi:MAG: preprotein translocase subunit SecG [Desulforegulaceae bacterium]|nr:preprotein translocase subunit SecG [Desulforegulaceae bacterium]
MTIFLVTIHIIASIMIIIMVLLQAGKGSSLGAALGGGSNQTLFGPTGSGNILTKITTGLAIVFMLTSISLAYMSGKSTSSSVVDKIKQEAPLQTNSVSETSNETAEKEASN